MPYWQLWRKLCSMCTMWTPCVNTNRWLAAVSCHLYIAIRPRHGVWCSDPGVITTVYKKVNKSGNTFSTYYNGSRHSKPFCSAMLLCSAVWSPSSPDAWFQGFVAYLVCPKLFPFSLFDVKWANSLMLTHAVWGQLGMLWHMFRWAMQMSHQMYGVICMYATSMSSQSFMQMHLIIAVGWNPWLAGPNIDPDADPWSGFFASVWLVHVTQFAFLIHVLGAYDMLISLTQQCEHPDSLHM